MSKQKSASSVESRSKYWSRQIRSWEKAGGTQVEFCRERGLSVASFRWWRCELKRRRAASRSPKKASRPGFVEWVPPTPVETRGSFSRTGGYEVLLTKGWRVRIPESFEPSSLRRLLAVLEEC